ncbi:MAG TPA: ATP-binding protein [Hanamia sp.]|nr:ATP-binding protein [Hanamia sp.]
MKKYLFVLLLVMGNHVCKAQAAQTVGQLKHELAIAKQDTSRVLIMAKLCFAYNYSLNPDSALYYGEAAYTLAHKIHFLGGEITALGFESFIQESLGNLPRSMELALEALQLAKDNHLEKYSGPALNAAAGVYNSLKDHSRALDYLRRQERLGDKADAGYAAINIANTLTNLNRPDSASYYLKRGDSILRSVGTVETGVIAQYGDIQMKSGNYPAALKLYRKALEAAIQNKELRSFSDIYTEIAALYKTTNQFDSASFYAKKALTIAQKLAQKDEILESATLLAQLYEPTNAETALLYYKIADVVKDSLYGSGSIQAIQTIIHQEQERQQDIKSNRIAYENRIRQYALFIGLGVLLLIAIFLYRNNRNKRKANVLLSKQKEEIQSTLSELKSTQKQLIQSEKMASLGELTAGIAHEIQNPLNFVNNFSDVNKELLLEMKDEMKKGNLDEANSIANGVIENEQKINHHGKRAGDIVKGMLQHSRTSTGVKEPTDINALADEYLRLSYHGLRAKDKSFNAKMKTDFDENLSADKAGIGKINIIPQDIRRVLLNLYNNAFYAVQQKQKELAKEVTPFEKVSPLYEPTVSATTKKSENSVLITVSDNGNGIPQKVVDKIFQPFFTTKPTGEGTGLGLSLAYDIVKAHGGELKVETKENEGSEFIIQLPI